MRGWRVGLLVALLAGCDDGGITDAGGASDAGATSDAGADAGPPAIDTGAADAGPTPVIEAITAATPGGTGAGANAIAADATHVYWVDADAMGGPTGRVRRVPIAGGDPETLAEGQPAPVSLALDATHAYFAASGEGGSIRRVPLEGGAVEIVVDAEPTPNAIAVTASHVYWTRLGRRGPGGAPGGLRRAPLGVGTSAELVADDPAGTGGVAVDGDTAYFTNLTSMGEFIGPVLSVAASGGTAESIAAMEAEPTGIALDATHVYWVNQGSLPSFVDGAVRRRARAGGEVETLASALGNPTLLAIDGGEIYFVGRHGAVGRVSSAGGDHVLVASGLEGVADAIALTPAHVWFFADGMLRRVAR